MKRRESGAFVEDLLEEAFVASAGSLSIKDRALCQELVYGAVRWQATLDWLIARKTTGRTQKAMLQNLLRLGLYQIFWLDRIPNHAAVNETVEQAKQGGFGPQAGFVNAVLRGYLREFDQTKALLAELKTAQAHLGYSHPEWLVNRWQKRWGAEKTAQLMDWNNTPPKTYARINELKFLASGPERRSPDRRVEEHFHRADPEIGAPKLKDAGELLTEWRNENVEYDFVRRDWFEENLVFELKSHPLLAKLPSFQQGYFYIQDPSTLLAVHELNPQPGETILDLCAAPGGKLTYVAQLMRNQSHLVAHDTSEERLRLIRENCSRLGVTCVETLSNSKFKTQNSRFDKILIDAPCSNTGVMRRRVDLRWRIRPQEIERLCTTQLELLRQAAAHLKPGGTLVYSTCSLEPEENEDVIQKFLQTEAAFQLQTQRELVSFADGTDGAFVARLVRILK